MVSVGTFVHGFDALVAASDRVAETLKLDGWAQIGHSTVTPRRLQWQRFVATTDLQRMMAQATVVICHGGMGVIGDAMRARRPIIAVPRSGLTTARHPANDQRAFVRRMAHLYRIEVCEDLSRLEHLVGKVLRGGRPVDYRLGSDVPEILGGYLRQTAGARVEPATPPHRPYPGRDAA